MVVSDFSSKVVFLDTAPLIYFIEGQSQYQHILSALFELNEKGSFSFVTSTMTLLEVLVKPIREGKTDIAQQYRNILTTAPGIELLEITTSISETAAHLRARHNLRTPDAIQLATAIEAGAHLFLTNDLRLKVATTIEVVSLDDLK